MRAARISKKQIPPERRASALSTRPLLSCPQTAWHKTGHLKKMRAARSSKKQIPLERRASAISTRFLLGSTSKKFPCMISPACRKKTFCCNRACHKASVTAFAPPTRLGCSRSPRAVPRQYNTNNVTHTRVPSHVVM